MHKNDSANIYMHKYTHKCTHKKDSAHIYTHNRILTGTMESVHRCELIPQGRSLFCGFLPGSVYGVIPALHYNGVPMTNYKYLYKEDTNNKLHNLLSGMFRCTRCILQS